VMNRGRIEQVGSTDQVYDSPSTPFVFDFLGSPNVLPGEVRADGIYLAGASAPIRAPDGFRRGPVDVYARPADFRVVGEDPAAIEGRIVETQRTGALVRLTVSLAAEAGKGRTVEIEVPNPDPEMKVWLAGERIRLRPAHFSLYSEHCPEPAPVAEDRSGEYAAPQSRARGR